MECFKWDLMGHLSRDIEDIGTERDFNSRGCSSDVLMKNDIPLSLV